MIKWVWGGVIFGLIILTYVIALYACGPYEGDTSDPYMNPHTRPATTGPYTRPPHATWVRPALRIEEDSPLWDCHTMGNRVCGA